MCWGQGEDVHAHEVIYAAILWGFTVFELLLVAVRLGRVFNDGLRAVSRLPAKLARFLLGTSKSPTTRDRRIGGSCGPCQTDDIPDVIRKELLIQKAIWANAALTVIGVYFALNAVPTADIVLSCTPDSRSKTQYVLFGISCMFIAVIQTSHSLLEGWKCSYMVLVLSALVGVYVSPLGMHDLGYFVKFHTTEYGWVALFLLLAASTEISFLCGVLITSCGLASYFHLSFELGPLYDLFWAGFKMVGLLLIQSFTLNYMEYKARTEAMNDECIASSELLRMMCDAVIELDDQLALVSHSKTLSNALFLSEGKSLKMLPFDRLVWPEDQSLVQSCLLEGGSGPTAGNMFQARLRDAWGSPVPMEFYHVRIKGPTGCTRHFIGLREHGESKGDTFTTDMPNVGNQSFQVEEVETEIEQVDVIPTPSMDITYASPRFVDLFGRAGSLTDILREPTSFMDWLLKASTKVENGKSKTEVLTFDRVLLRHGKGWKQRCAQVYFPARDDPDSLDPYRVSVKLVSINRLQKCSKESRKSSSLRGDVPSNDRRGTPYRSEHHDLLRFKMKL